MSMPQRDLTVLSDNRHFAKRYKGLAWLRYWAGIYLGFANAWLKLWKTLRKKECYYGPFKGEFGHFLAHNLPFIAYLHSRGVKIHYCGMKLHSPFLVDEHGNSLVATYHELRDFFAEVPPRLNRAIPPADVQHEIEAFHEKAQTSGLPFWNINDEYYYWFIHRSWLLKGRHLNYPDLSKVYRTANEKSCVLFPRSKGAASSLNNGEAWDYDELAELLSPHFDKVYITGHPSQTLAVRERGNIVLRISADNRNVLETCANASLIITQHSGAVYLADYVPAQVLLIYKGGTQIGSLVNTLRFRGKRAAVKPFHYAFSTHEIVTFVKKQFA
jgi:hypothetical protein